MKANRFERRHSKEIERKTVYFDNQSVEYDYKWVAQCSSFANFISGGLKNGFPVVLNWLWYDAWAFYPFFFFKKGLTKEASHLIIHERIHCRQQKDIYVAVGLPFCMLAVALSLPLVWFMVVPFLPTIFYMFELIRVSIVHRSQKIPLSELRNFSAFEREAISRSLNADYFKTRKFFAVLAYTGIKIFRNYGIR